LSFKIGRGQTEPVGSILREYLKAYDIENKLNEVRLIDSWPDVVGIQIAKRTEKLLVKNRVLFVYLKSSIVRAELLRIREALPEALNKKAGANVIDDIVIR
jgi:predicted nucleic acid-binding Zn ribbon protein